MTTELSSFDKLMSSLKQTVQEMKNTTPVQNQNVAGSNQNQEKKDKKDKDNANIIAYLIDYAKKLKFLIDPKKQLHVIVPKGSDTETLPLLSNAFKNYLNMLILEKYVKILPNSSISPVIGVIELYALDSAEPRDFIKRFASDETNLYIDLNNPDKQYLKVDIEDNKIDIVKNTPFILHRYENQQALPLPQSTEKDIFDWFFDLMKIQDKEDRLLIVSFLVSKLFIGFQTPILWLHGPSGSGKTLLAKAIMNIIDPRLEVMTMPTNKFNLGMMYDHQFLPVIDNVSGISREFSDWICQAYSGVSMMKKVEYSVDDEHSYIIKNSGIFTSIHTDFLKEDLVTRTFFIERQRFDSHGFSERQIMSKLREQQPFLFGKVIQYYTHVSRSIKDKNGPIVSDRSQDFCHIMQILSKLLFDSDDLYEKVIFRNNNRRIKQNTDSNEAVGYIIDFMSDKSSFEGTIGTLIQNFEINGYKLSYNMKNPATFARSLRQGEDILKIHGITFKKGTKGHQNSYYQFTNSRYIPKETEETESTSF